MTWIFGSFLVTACALTSCYAVMCKQGYESSTSGALGYNRCVTERSQHDEKHAVRFRQSAENRSRGWDTKPIRGVSDELARGVQALAPPWLPEEDMRRRSPLSEYMSLYLSN